MANELTLPNGGQLPSYFGKFQQGPAITDNVIGGLSAGSHPRISIKGSRWRLNDVQGNETVWPHLALDVIILNANPHLSKVFYEKPYDPTAGDFVAPDCWSDNGVGPSARAEKPQCRSCAECPQNVWGSKITAQGKQARACGDFKKLAVLPVHAPQGDIYELRIPPASLGNLGNVAKQLQDKGIPLPAGIMRLSFDPSAEHPKILFDLAGYVPESWADYVLDLITSDEVYESIGTKDVVRTAPLLASAPAPVAALGAAPQMPNTAFTPTAPQMPTMMPQQPPAPAFQPQPQAALTTQPHPHPVDYNPQADPSAIPMPQFTYPQPVAAAPQAPQMAAQPPLANAVPQAPQKPKRQRKAAPEAPVAQAQPQAPQAMPMPQFAPPPQPQAQAPQAAQPMPMPAYQQPQPGYQVAYQEQPQPQAPQPMQTVMPPHDQPFNMPAAAATSGAVPLTNPSLDAMLAQAMKR